MPSVTETFDAMRPKKFSTNHQPVGWAVLALVFGLMVSVGTEFQKVESWAELRSVEHCMHAIQVAGGVGIAWIGQFLRK